MPIKSPVFILLVSLCLTVFTWHSASAVESAANANKVDLSAHESAVLNMQKDPDAAAKILGRAVNDTQKMDYALFLFAYRQQTRQRNQHIGSIINGLNTAAIKQLKEINDEFGLEVLREGLVAFDGSDKALIASLRLTSSAAVIQTASAFYAIPCDVLKVKPGLLRATLPIWGGNRDNFLPRSGCQWGRGEVSGFPEQKITNYIQQATCCDGDFINRYEGTLRYALMANQTAQLETVKLDPAAAQAATDLPLDYPYLTWSYLSLSNKERFEALKDSYQMAREALSAFYAKNGKITAATAGQYAKSGLHAVVFGAGCGNSSPLPSLRKLLIEGANVNQLRQFVESGAFQQIENLQAFFNCAQYAGIEPLIHIAVKDSAALKYLWQWSRSLNYSPQQQKESDLELAIDAANVFAKTPLMTAAQFDLYQSARFLIEQGANVNAQTDSKQSATVELRYDQRTALMYAAASASLPLIKLLLDNGADVNKKDSQGLRAIDYLTGNGPLPRNSRLLAPDFAAAQKYLAAGVK